MVETYVCFVHAISHKTDHLKALNPRWKYPPQYCLVHPLPASAQFAMCEANMTWAGEEFGGAEPGDKRLNRRLMKLTERFADKPMASILGTCSGWSDTQASYWFVDQANNANGPMHWDIPEDAGGILIVTCVVGEEMDPPSGNKPVEWRLRINRGVAFCRGGCRVEALQLGSVA